MPFYGQDAIRKHPLKDTVEIQRQGLQSQIKSIEESLKSLPTVSDSIVYDYSEDSFLNGYEYCVQVFLKNGDVLEFYGVTEGLDFSSITSGGIYRINDMSFFLHGVFGVANSGIPSKYLFLAITQEESKRSVHTKKNLKLMNIKKHSTKYEDIPSILQDYTKVRYFLLDTPYGTNCGTFHSAMQNFTQVFGRICFYDRSLIILDETSVNNIWKFDFYRKNGYWFGREKRNW